MKRTTRLRIIRISVQLAAFLLFPGMFILALGGLKAIVTASVNGSFKLRLLFPQLMEVFVTVPLTVLLGRFFCGWVCAFGAFTDFIYMIFHKLIKIRFRMPEKIDSLLKYLKYVVLGFILLFIWIGRSNAFATLSPWNAFAQLGVFPWDFSKYAAGLAILSVIAFASVFTERFFCRYLCPLGAVFSLISAARIFRIRKPSEKCGGCRLCTRECSMGLNLYRMDRVNSGNCINCMKCIAVCPSRNPKAYAGNQELSPAFAGALAISAFAGFYAVSGLTAANINIAGSQVTAYADSGGEAGTAGAAGTYAAGNGSGEAAQGGTQAGQMSKYRDGTYIGVGYGHRPGLRVSVTIKGGKISDMQIVSDMETPRFSRVAFSVIPEEIMNAQSADVDAVSGATETSDGIMQAVNDALSQAMAN